MALESEIRSPLDEGHGDVVTAQEGTDDVYAVAEHGRPPLPDRGAGPEQRGRNTFWIPLGQAVPDPGEMGEITVEVYDSDTFSDDMISISSSTIHTRRVTTTGRGTTPNTTPPSSSTADTTTREPPETS